MKSQTLLIIFACIVLAAGCQTQNTGNSSAPTTFTSSTSSATTNSEPVPNQPKTYSNDLSGQVERITDEGSDDSQIRQNIAGVDKSITYEHLKKNADKYAGKPWAARGKIIQIREADGETSALVSLDGWGNKNIWIVGNFSSDFVENNQVYVVGYLAGNYSYTSIANWQLTIPALAVRAMLKPGEVSKYQNPSKRK